jgi:hypothetical protein
MQINKKQIAKISEKKPRKESFLLKSKYIKMEIMKERKYNKAVKFSMKPSSVRTIARYFSNENILKIINNATITKGIRKNITFIALYCLLVKFVIVFSKGLKIFNL